MPRHSFIQMSKLPNVKGRISYGKLPVLKVGRKTIIRRDTLERFLTVNQGRNLLKPDDVRRVE